MEFAFRVYSFALSGSVCSGETDVTISVVLPVAAMLFRGTIEDQVRKELGRILAS